MTLTQNIKNELATVRVPSVQERVAELSSVLRFGGSLHLISQRLALEVQLDDVQVARRVFKDLTELYHVKVDSSRVSPSGVKKTEHYLLRVLDAEALVRKTGLLDQRNRLVRGLPAPLVNSSLAEAAAIWRGAFLAKGSLTDPGRAASLEVGTPSNEASIALVGIARRLGIAAKNREVRGAARVVIREPEAIGQMLKVIGAEKSAADWEEIRQRKVVRAAANRLVNFDDANLRRSAQAAVAACARVERALEILQDQVPSHLRYAGELRLRYRDASLDELGHHAEPPMTKDAVAGRIRRLLAMADKKAAQLGIPDTEASLPDNLADL